MTVEKRKKKKKRRERKEKKVSHQGSPNFKLLIHRQSSSAPKAFCYCHCPEDFAQEFEEQKKGWSWIHPLETLSPSSSVGIVFSSTTVIIIIEVYGAGPTEGQKLRGQKKGWSWIHPLETLSPSRGVNRRSTEEEYFASNNAKNGEWGGNDPLAPLFSPTLWSWLIPMWPKAQGPGPPEHMGTWGQVLSMLAD